ncbi:protein GOLVEN 6 [Gossypium hirsutum]|uniref:Protein GOLVEN 6 n=1 Tax=Gossypium hirsutum TaxID=3635 RepID=A0ABM2ZDD7_GOSHI|nr:protein GOLVEN 6-like [Gossypium hirsutum]
MELIVSITVLCFTFLALQTPCTSLQIKLQSSDEQGKTFKGNEAHHSIRNSKQKENASGKAYQKERGTVHASRGTRQEWMESGTDISQYFTMDYSHVRRRRPIHNKSLPVGP